ncbi:hypothetical protein MKX01_038425 [Papaver californicum]|nr:hypothetical protein MKX01_038425 [Papaver californicum]
MSQEMMKSKNFSQTCDLLSQYMKGNKGSFAPPAMNLSSSASAMCISSESAQMTIFYGGRIMVLDNLTEDNAKQVLGFAENFPGSYIVNTRETSSNNFVASNNNLVCKDLLLPRNQQQQQQQQAIASDIYINASDVPAAKKTSLQRFLAKRKERINTRAAIST